MNKYAGSDQVEQDEVNWLFLDLNSFFASCEQQMNPYLRGRPVAIVPGMVDTTSCIAASYEAKAYGVKTGTMVRDAKKLCPDIVLIEARHRPYVQFHHAIKEAFETVLPVDQVMSIDEFAAPLIGRQRRVEAAVDLAHQAKRAIAAQVGECLTSSIGIAPNRWLAKVASDMQKPNGLTVLRHEDLPHALHRLQLRDLCGIGSNMEFRLNDVGIFTVEELCAAPTHQLKAAWGGVEGLRMYALLRGEDIERPPTKTSCIGHQHVLEPELRTPDRAYQYLRYLLMKAAQRLREKGFYARALTLNMKWMNNQSRLGNYDDYRLQFAETQDTRTLLRALGQIWRDVPRLRPLRVGLVLSDLVPSDRHQLDLFAAPEATQEKGADLLASLDRINNRYGTGTVGFGTVRQMVTAPIKKDGAKAVDGRISFSRVPELSEFHETGMTIGSLRYWKPGQPLGQPLGQPADEKNRERLKRPETGFAQRY